MMMILGYCIGAVLHIGVKILGYIGAHKDQTVRNYWSLYGALVAKGAIFDVVIFGLWQIGFIPYLAKMIGVAMPEGFVLPEGVDVWLGVTAGYAADSIGKSFMGAIERFYSKGMGTLSGKANGS